MNAQQASPIERAIQAIRAGAEEYAAHEREITLTEWRRHLERVMPAQHAALREMGAGNVDWVEFPLEQRRTERWRVDGHLIRVIYTMDGIVVVPTEATATDRADWRAQLGGVISD